ncbi:hypothetical protein BDN67DRAFT_971009 [Paxillus ammoniavirescens]|nr:hypothetical protein BDN67DRAFT_971009 [Paxillus ammoniavirescens]
MTLLDRLSDGSCYMAHDPPSKKLVKTSATPTSKVTPINHLISMQLFLTLLASIASLNAYTLMGVHANPAWCAACPSSFKGQQLAKKCVDSSNIGHC